MLKHCGVQSEVVTHDDMFFVAASSKKAVILSSLRDHDEIPMKYQQLENLECGWKWKYLVKNIGKVN